jgi:hypothetical protein
VSAGCFKSQRLVELLDVAHARCSLALLSHATVVGALFGSLCVSTGHFREK